MKIYRALVTAAFFTSNLASAEPTLDLIAAKDELAKAQFEQHQAEALEAAANALLAKNQTILALYENLYERAAVKEIFVLEWRKNVAAAEARLQGARNGKEEATQRVRLKEFQKQIALGQVIEPSEAQSIYQAMALNRCHRISSELLALQAEMNFSQKWLEHQRPLAEKNYISKVEWLNSEYEAYKISLDAERAQKNYDVCDVN